VNILLSCNLSIALSNCKLFCSIEATTTLTHRAGETQFFTKGEHHENIKRNRHFS
jgi:hypothetical protein